MTRRQQQALLRGMDRAWAEEVLRDRGGSLSSKDLYAVTLLATGDKLKAADARSRRALEEMHVGRTPEV